MTRRATWLRTAVLLCAGALAVHELRYLLAFGAGSAGALAHDGHAYLSAIHPLVALVTAAVLAQFMRLAARGATAGTRRATTFVRSWAHASLAVLAIYAVQELVEGAVAAGHPSDLAAVTAHGGLIVVPVAVAVGAIVAVFLREASRATARLRSGLAPCCFIVLPERAVVAPARRARLRVLLLARHLAGRAPPLVSA